MPRICQIISLVSFLVYLSSCGESRSRIVSFDAAFPKANKNLENILGKQLTLKSGIDTLRLKITANQNSNLITSSATGDTLFYGKVSKYRGLYYFNQPLTDSTYFIYAVNIKDNLIYGLSSPYLQSADILSQVLAGSYQDIVTFIAPDTSQIKLHTDKKALRKLFTNVLQNVLPDTILPTLKKAKINLASTALPENTDTEELQMLAEAYPNPAQNYINIKLHDPQKVSYQLLDLGGKIVGQGQLEKSVSRLDLARIPKGMYALTLTNPGQNQETIKIVKN